MSYEQKLAAAKAYLRERNIDIVAPGCSFTPTSSVNTNVALSIHRYQAAVLGLKNKNVYAVSSS